MEEICTTLPHGSAEWVKITPQVNSFVNVHLAINALCIKVIDCLEMSLELRSNQPIY